MKLKEYKFNLRTQSFGRSRSPLRASYWPADCTGHQLIIGYLSSHTPWKKTWDKLHLSTSEYDAQLWSSPDFFTKMSEKTNGQS